MVRSIGVMPQSAGLPSLLRVAEAVQLFASYYDDPLDADELIDRVGLGERRRSPWRALSGGERQRLSLALALVGRPRVAFLDEPTAGIDPTGRTVVRSMVDDLRTQGVAVVLTTHDLTEAERLADRIAIMDRGQVVASGTLAELTTGAGPAADAFSFTADAGLDTAGLATAIGGPVTEGEPGRYQVAAAPTPARLADLTGWLATRGHGLRNLDTGGSTLEDVFARLTGDGNEP
jgi:ABC-2 type transport system ATP-binding protein